MKTLVVYDSVYGNTDTIARAIGAALSGDVEVRRVGEVGADELATVDLLIVGSPTHGALPTEAVQAWVAELGPPVREGARAATFDTRLTWRILERWGGFAAPKLALMLEDQGWPLAGEPGGFFVRGLKKGPLKRGEAERAAVWARGLVASQG
jgi:flavorubredoxin